jgi:hypothetical protein
MRPTSVDPMFHESTLHCATESALRERCYGCRVPRKLDAKSVRAYMARDWRALRDAKRQYWRDRLDQRGLAEALRVSDLLRTQATSEHPAWPTVEQRDEDLETHQRVAQALRATEKTPRRTISRARARRVR